MNVSKLEEMGTILMHIALQYTHPDFESMYSDWSTVHDIGEKLVKMSDQPQLNENQQSIEEYVEMAIVQLREANLILNKVYEKDRFAREIQDDISEIMGTLRYRYFGEQEEE